MVCRNRDWLVLRWNMLFLATQCLHVRLSLFTDVGARFASRTRGLLLDLGLKLRLSWVQGVKTTWMGRLSQGIPVGKFISSSLHLSCNQSYYHPSAKT